MIKIRSNIIERLLIVDLLCVIIMNTFTVFQNDMIVSGAFIVTFICTFAMFVYYLIYRRFVIYTSTFVILVVIVIASFAVFLTCQQELTFEYIKKLVIFICSFLYLVVVSDITISHTTQNRIKMTIYIMSGVYIGSYYLLGVRTMYKTSGLLSMNYTNPNLLGMWLCITFIFLVMNLFYVTKTCWKVVTILDILLLLPLLFQSGARNVIIPCISVFLLPIILWKTKNIKKVIIVTLFIPLIFVIIYMYGIDFFSETEQLHFLVSEGKELDSRFDVWSNLLEIYWRSPLWGDYYIISGGSGVSQCLNTHLDILCSYGIFAYIGAMIAMINIYLKASNAMLKTVRSIVVYAAMLSATLIGVGEAALFSGGIGIYIIVFIGFPMLQYDGINE